MKSGKKILFIAQYPKEVSPGQRFRFELYIDLLTQNGFYVEMSPFLDDDGYNIIHKKGYLVQKIWRILKGFSRRVTELFTLHKFDFIFLQREAALLGPPMFEWLYTRIFKKKLIYDFDDAIWMPHISDGNSLFLKLKVVNKVSKICSWAYKISAGNVYLCDYARHYNDSVIFNPTCVDTQKKHNIATNHNVEKLTIGWTGSFSTLKYLNFLVPALQKLQKTYDFNIKIICNQQPSLNLKNIQYVEWSLGNEVKELATCQIGLMPLTPDEWSEGKCGFKLIQYLALEIPAVASPVGVNKKIIDHHVNGFLCNSEMEWYAAIEKLILDPELRKRMGTDGRKKIIREYSLLSNQQNFLSLFS